MFSRIFHKYLSYSVAKEARYVSYYITTPIFYANSSPHIGHVHTLLLADALNVFQRLKLNTTNTILSTGTDEHGIKIQNAAQLANIDCQQFCDDNSNKFFNLFKKYETTLTHFIRTTEGRHKRAVETVWEQLQSSGFIYKSTYEGWYCNTEESFCPESHVIRTEIDGRTIHTDQNGNHVTWSSEENYMFKLNNFKDRVLDWLVNQRPIAPEKFNDLAINMLNSPDISDISVSRPLTRLKWGIPVPGDPTQTIYVWLDALVNYLTVVGFPCPQEKLTRWPIDCQVIGKDIIKFHALYWPAFLCALSMPLPNRLICHSHWLVDSRKMSKSVGNVVDPDRESDLIGLEGLRYYLLRAGTTHSDTDYISSSVIQRVNSELADTYGNLLGRCTAKAINPEQVIPVHLTDNASPEIRELSARLDELANTCAGHYEVADFYRGIDDIMSIMRQNNAIYEHAKPWKLVKSNDSFSYEKYMNTQAITFETLRICSILLQPIVPNISKSALNRMNVEGRSWNNAKVTLDFGNPDTDQRQLNQSVGAVIYPRIKTK